MAKEIAFENGRISNFEGLVSLTLTLDQVKLHIVMHHSSTATYMSNFTEIEETFCGRTDRRTYACTHVRTYKLTFTTSFIRSTLSKSRPKYVSLTKYLNNYWYVVQCTTMNWSTATLIPRELFFA